jgi:pimeloyl-ACP methyl ester carboxylesterase
MSDRSNAIDWNSGFSSALVSIGTHSLFLTASGPSRSGASTPAIIIEAGAGDNHTSWSAVIRLTSPFARIYSYDRAGLGLSGDSPSERNAEVMARELSLLLEAARVEPPYILVAHSYGGIIAREFVALRGENVVGMVLVDTSHEDLEVEGEEIRIPSEARRAVMGGLDYVAVTGLESTHKFTAEEWDAFLHAEEGSEQGLARERAAIEESHMMSKWKRQLDLCVLGDRTLSVIQGHREWDFRKLYEAGVAKGNGTREQQLAVEKTLDRMEELDVRLTKDQMGLSRNSRYVVAESSGHDVQVTQPELIAEEIRWVLEPWGRLTT